MQVGTCFTPPDLLACGLGTHHLPAIVRVPGLPWPWLRPLPGRSFSPECQALAWDRLSFGHFHLAFQEKEGLILGLLCVLLL